MVQFSQSGTGRGHSFLHDELYDEDGTGLLNLNAISNRPVWNIATVLIASSTVYPIATSRLKRGADVFSVVLSFKGGPGLDRGQHLLASHRCMGLPGRRIGFDWPRATNWLDHGRLLSLCWLLDAARQPLFDRKPRSCTRMRHGCAQPPDFDTLKSVLEAYVERDNAPRVKMMTAFILKNAVVVTSGE